LLRLSAGLLAELACLVQPVARAVHVRPPGRLPLAGDQRLGYLHVCRALARPGVEAAGLGVDHGPGRRARDGECKHIAACLPSFPPASRLFHAGERPFSHSSALYWFASHSRLLLSPQPSNPQLTGTLTTSLVLMQAAKALARTRTAQSMSETWAWRQLCALAGALNVLVLMTANMVGWIK
jgi:hypothetical protein